MWGAGVGYRIGWDKVSSARLKLGPCPLATGDHGWSPRGGLSCVHRDSQVTLTVMPGDD